MLLMTVVQEEIITVYLHLREQEIDQVSACTTARSEDPSPIVFLMVVKAYILQSK